MLRSEISPSKPEERFVELFQEVFGPAAVAKLEMQRPFQDILGGNRFMDFALDSLLARYALEIDGETYHHPAALTSQQYEDQLLRQNSLIHQGWRVLRWTDRQLAHNSEGVKEQLAVLLDEAIRLCIPADYLPVKRGALLPMREHQQEALEELAAMRARGVQIALLAHAVATGKTTVAVEDARSLGGRTLFLAHTHELVSQALERFAQLWPEASRAELGQSGENEAQVVVGTVQFMAKNLARYGAKDFAYLVVDEAHHATSNSYRAVLRYFDPEFLLGLTGTPERADGKNALEVFQETAHRMDIESAVKAGVLCDVRCFRVETNIDLKRLRFNGNLYNQKDLEDRVSIPARNELIVKTYADNVPHRLAVCFCVSVAHAEKMAALFGEAGFAAQAVSGRQSKEERAAILARFGNREIQVLCACDVLNEGWDAPEVEVLLMARPTLSKVIYQQQLGRGMRSAPQKQFLVLFDFVDAFGRHNQALNIHRWLKRPQYRAGARLFEPEKDGDEAILEVPLHLWTRDLVPINVFDWQETVEGMLTARNLSQKLRKTDEWVFDVWKRGDIEADEVIELGDERRIPYFLPEREAELRQKFGIAEVTSDDLWADFLQNVGDMAMTRSYKPVFLLALLKCTDETGRARVADVVASFWSFYRARAERGEIAELGNSSLREPESLSLSEVQALMNRHPFSRFERLEYLAYASDRAFFEWNKAVWKHLSQPENRAEVEFLVQKSLENYFARGQ
jgi:superfamily II DNA or RNA helicase